MLVRIFENADGSLRILRPNPRLQIAGESDKTFIVRIGDAAIAGDSGLTGLSFVDLDSSELPSDLNERQKWRLDKGKVVEKK